MFENHHKSRSWFPSKITWFSIAPEGIPLVQSRLFGLDGGPPEKRVLGAILEILQRQILRVPMGIGFDFRRKMGNVQESSLPLPVFLAGSKSMLGLYNHLRNWTIPYWGCCLTIKMQIFHCHLRLPEGTRGRYIEPGGDRQHGASPSFMLVEPLHDLQGIGSGRSLGAVFGNMGVREILVGCTNLHWRIYSESPCVQALFFSRSVFGGGPAPLHVGSSKGSWSLPQRPGVASMTDCTNIHPKLIC